MMICAVHIRSSHPPGIQLKLVSAKRLYWAKWNILSRIGDRTIAMQLEMVRAWCSVCTSTLVIPTKSMEGFTNGYYLQLSAFTSITPESGPSGEHITVDSCPVKSPSHHPKRYVTDIVVLSF
jgi:hypothetical protein